MRKPGTVPPVVYFVNHSDPNHPKGYIMLAPYSQCPDIPGYQREERDTLPEIYRLEKELQQQDYRENEQIYQREWEKMQAHWKGIKDDLISRMTSSDCSEHEKEFIRLAMQLRDEKKLKEYQQRYLEHTSYLWILHHSEGPDRRADEEKVNLDKVNF